MRPQPTSTEVCLALLSPHPNIDRPLVKGEGAKFGESSLSVEPLIVGLQRQTSWGVSLLVLCQQLASLCLCRRLHLQCQLLLNKGFLVFCHLQMHFHHNVIARSRCGAVGFTGKRLGYLLDMNL